MESTQLIVAASERELAELCPTFSQQYDLQRKLSALKQYTKDKRYAITDIYAQRLMAVTIKEAMAAGEVKAERDGKGTPKYSLCNLHNNKIDGSEVDRWRKLKAIPASQCREYFNEVSNPSRNGLLRWWKTQTVVANGKQQQKPLKKISNGIVLGDWRTESESLVANDSVELIFTDPPYFTEFVPQYGDLARFAVRVLVPGGSLITYVGHRLVPQILKLMEIEGLSFYWINAIVHTGRKSRMPLTGQIVGFKPLLWFVKGNNRFDTSTFVEDTIISEPSTKELHPWQQSLVEAEYYVSTLSTEGGLVCDPYCGSGTTSVACKNLKREWITFDIDPTHVATARKAVKDA